MKLKSLWIQEYKNLKDFQLDFEKGNHLSILIGNNGSGKSNVLEAISGIFTEWYGIPASIFYTDYKIEYEYDGKYIVLQKTDKKKVYYVDSALFEDSKVIPYLPSNVVALYSGEDLRLFENFYFPKYDSYLKDVYRKGFVGKMGMYYVNKYLWNIALLTLITFSERLPDVQSFLATELGIFDDSYIKHVRITFNFKDYNKNTNNLLKNFINTINPNQDKGKEYTIQEWRTTISSLVVNSEAEPIETFNYLMQAFMPKTFKIIEKIQILFSNGITLESLSEGEKKLILIKAVLEFVADENALLLLDEPDANIHESRKSKLYKLLKDTPNRDIVMTTHSPILAKIADEKELIYLESKNGIVSEISMDKLKLVRALASNEWNIMDAGIFLNTDKPLVLFEGKSDITYVKKAIELLKIDNPKYEKINIDILSFNGTGNSEDFLRNIRAITPNKKLIFFFDRDNGGKDGMSHVSGISKNDASIIQYHDYEDNTNLLKAVFLPCPDGVSEDFMIEDYFPKEKIEEVFNELIKIEHPYTKVIGKKFEEKFKEMLERNCKNYSKSDFQGFTLLLNKLLELLNIK